MARDQTSNRNHGLTNLAAMTGDLGETLGDEYVHQLPDTDPVETQEWIESLDAVV